MLSRVRTLVLVTLVALLVWVFAEAEGLRSAEAVVELVFDAEPGGNRSVEVVGAAPGPMGATVVLEGAADAVDAAARRLRRGSITISPGMEGVPISPGEHTLALREVLRTHPDLRTLGVSIKKAEPETVRVAVDELQTLEMKVVPALGEGEADDAPDARPGAVKVTAPARLLAARREGATAVARIDPERFARLIPGRRETVSGVAVELPDPLRGAPRVRIDPPSVDVTLTPKQRTLSVRLASVPVHVRIAPGEMSKFDVEIAEPDRTLIDVTIVGPAELVQPFADRTRTLIAEVPLSYEELERGIASKDAIFASVPTSLKFEVANRTVRLTIKRRGGGEGSPPKGPP